MERKPNSVLTLYNRCIYIGLYDTILSAILDPCMAPHKRNHLIGRFPYSTCKDKPMATLVSEAVL